MRDLLTRWFSTRMIALFLTALALPGGMVIVPMTCWLRRRTRQA
jgi:hypothetical protein